ncbi:catalase [Bosea sp. (in: a-proteobacteria)]|uniref:catalase n=1 Tax=Bosea sp. (in: a-proteobacteria) TaxID=1871050 RepID=UPI001AC52938|nr:catalase [Bosea sp. (in: a-proteobacteria)]MBN9439371.1 catalase [Bosea sp. (in: a-proteobacteria)]
MKGTKQSKPGNAGETHQTATGREQRITTNHGVPVSDNQNSLRAGSQGPSLLEDFVLREKIQHFDHERMLANLRNVDETLAKRVADALGMPLPTASQPALAPQDMEASPALRIIGKYPQTLEGRTIGILVTDGADGEMINALKTAVETEGGKTKIVAPRIGGVSLKKGAKLKADGQLAGSPSVIFDAVALVLSEEGCSDLLDDAAALDFTKDAFGHLKAIGFSPQARPLLEKAGVFVDAGIVALSDDPTAVVEAARTRQWDREARIRSLA